MALDTTKTRSDPRRVRMSSGERPIGAAKGKQPNTEALCQPPPPLVQETPLHSKRGGEGRGNRHFHCPKFTEKFDIELLPRVCWLDKVVAFVHCCVLHASFILGTVLDPVSCRPLSFSQCQPCMLSILRLCGQRVRWSMGIGKCFCQWEIVFHA